MTVFYIPRLDGTHLLGRIAADHMDNIDYFSLIIGRPRRLAGARGNFFSWWNLASLLALWLAFGAPAQAWWNPDYSLREKITVDTSAAGGNIAGAAGSVQLLVRLSGSFQFDAAKDDGSDIRLIAGDDKTPLAYHLEKFDANLGEAFVWVKVPDLKANGVTTLWLYYGSTNANKEAAGAADVKGTYDSDTVLVYHFTEAGKNPHDYSGNNNDADTLALTTDGSIIGPGLRLDGKTPVRIKASDSLNWTDGAPLTWSAWVKPMIAQPNAVIFSRRDGARDFLVGMNNLVPYLEINGQPYPASAPVTATSWNHVAVVGEASKVTLYVNGTVAATANVGLPGLASEMTLGADSGNGSGTPFSGELDELEIAKATRPPGFITFSAMSQNVDTASKLVVVGSDEQPPASWLSGSLGLIGVILKSVTVDGWVVIGFLVILALVSWFVMITKFFYLNSIAKGNRAFMEQWRHLSSDLTALDHADPNSIRSMGGRLGDKLQRLMRTSPLYQIYHIGSEEIAHRIPPTATERELSAQSIQAIRASLDTGFVRQGQAISNGLVFLTISIAGGPFIGLFGTVAGVMITFASIAATGEVNIDAIAPGIAAALVATMAGLAVAIPALLGYNYLMSRINDITADMQIFIDEFVTKMAEFYRPSAKAVESIPGMEAFANHVVRQLIASYRLDLGRAATGDAAAGLGHEISSAGDHDVTSRSGNGQLSDL